MLERSQRVRWQVSAVRCSGVHRLFDVQQQRRHLRSPCLAVVLSYRVEFPQMMGVAQPMRAALIAEVRFPMIMDGRPPESW